MRTSCSTGAIQVDRLSRALSTALALGVALSSPRGGFGREGDPPRDEDRGGDGLFGPRAGDADRRGRAQGGALQARLRRSSALVRRILAPGRGQGHGPRAHHGDRRRQGAGARGGFPALQGAQGQARQAHGAAGQRSRWSRRRSSSSAEFLDNYAKFPFEKGSTKLATEIFRVQDWKSVIEFIALRAHENEREEATASNKRIAKLAEEINWVTGQLNEMQTKDDWSRRDRRRLRDSLPGDPRARARLQRPRRAAGGPNTRSATTRRRSRSSSRTTRGSGSSPARTGRTSRSRSPRHGRRSARRRRRSRRSTCSE